MLTRDLFVPTETNEFWDGTVKIVVEIQNDERRYAWRMKVGNGEFCDWTSHYQGILRVENYILASPYWDGKFPAFIPLRVVPL